MRLQLPSPLVEWILGPPGRQRAHVSQILLAETVYAAFACLHYAQALAGMMPMSYAHAISAFTLTGGFVFFLLVRSGLSQHLSAEPSLTLPQSLFTLIPVCWSYAISGPTRGAALLALMMVIVFGPFALDRRQSLLVAGLGLAGLAGVMLWRVFGGPPRYELSTELVHFFATLIVVSCQVAVSVQLGNLRGRLSRQKKDLLTALERIQDLATRDGLTGLLNRRAMLEKLDQETQRVRRGAAPVAIVLIDLDHFKRINDTHGHACGDRLLCVFASVAQEGLRASDALARWGGEEFLLVLPMTTPDEAAVCVQRVRRRLAALPLDTIAPGLALTFSAGIALCHDSADIARSIECADQALYKAKAQGRNRSVIAESAVAAQVEPTAAGVKDPRVPGSATPLRPIGARAAAPARNTAAS